MQRGIYAIALSDEAVEAGLIARGEAQPAFSRSEQFPATQPSGQDRQPAMLEAFLAQAQWEQGWVVLVLPTDRVSVRRLHFEFSDPRKIRQVLPLELGDQLLDGVDAHAWDADIRPGHDGTADVVVYLVERAPLEAAVATLEQHRLSLQRATFSAQALLQAFPPSSGNHVCVYAGAEECFAAATRDGHLEALQSLAPHPGELLARLRELDRGSSLEQLRALFRPDSGGAGDADRRALREALRARLEHTVDDLNRFVRIHRGGQPCTLSLYGLFGDLLEWHEGHYALSLRFPEGAWPGPRRTHLGVLQELLEAPRNLTTGRGLNFFRRVGTWLVRLREVRTALAVAAVLLLVLMALAGTGFFMRMSALQSHLDLVDRDIEHQLGVPPPLTSFTINAAIADIQERIDKLRKQRAAAAQLASYHYDALRLLRDVSQVIKQQQGVSVDSLSFNSDRFTLSGVTPSYAEAEQLKERIAALPRFKGRTVRVTNSNVGQVIRFRLTAEP